MPCSIRYSALRIRLFIALCLSLLLYFLYTLYSFVITVIVLRTKCFMHLTHRLLYTNIILYIRLLYCIVYAFIILSSVHINLLLITEKQTTFILITMVKTGIFSPFPVEDLVWYYGISTIVGYLIPNLFLYI